MPLFARPAHTDRRRADPRMRVARICTLPAVAFAAAHSLLAAGRSCGSLASELGGLLEAPNKLATMDMAAFFLGPSSAIRDPTADPAQEGKVAEDFLLLLILGPMLGCGLAAGTRQHKDLEALVQVTGAVGAHAYKPSSSAEHVPNPTSLVESTVPDGEKGVPG